MTAAKKANRSRSYLDAGSLLSETRRLLRRYGLRARKGLGQHFLIDDEALRLIVSAAELGAGDVVVEVGPGLGVLTRELAASAGWVIAVELDDRLADILKQTLASFGNINVVRGDILQIDPAFLLQEQKVNFPPAIKSPSIYKVVANLPYYITSPVIRHFLEASIKPQVVVLTVQKEVAEAIVAEPGQMSVLSVSVQFYGKASIVSYVPSRCFYPEPGVDSAVLRIDLYPRPAAEVDDVDGFFSLVRAGFSAPRKQIANALANGLSVPRAEVLPLLKGADMDPQRRAETLNIEDWARLWRKYVQGKGQVR